jgi:ABC-type sugar transport system ATPase subunit
VTKRFPGVTALDRVSLTVRAGEVHALTGENGSGKSTLARIIAGVITADGGTLEIAGQREELQGPASAIAKGIVLISQELTLAPTLTVAENIFVGRLPMTRWRTIDWRRLEADAVEALDRLDVHVDPRQVVGTLDIELQQEVEIARAFSSDARLLILDEATSSLSGAATNRLLDLVEEHRQAGIAVLMITHIMSELYRAASVATVLRDGKLVGTVSLAETTEHELVRMMVGREIGDFYGKRRIPRSGAALEVQELETPDGSLLPTSFAVSSGEILGVAGLVGSGKSELGLALGGAIPSVGSVRVAGKSADLRSPRASLASGLAYVPEDRKRAAILPNRSVAENLSLAWLDDLERGGVLNVRKEHTRVQEAISRYGIVTASERTPISALSGGNQQKVVVGRILALRPKVLVLGEPTRGIDVGAKSHIYGLLQDAAEQGAAIVLISSELPELLGIADRIIAFYRGRFCAEFQADVDEGALAHAIVTGMNSELAA